jgi:hypothetical protein
MESRKTAALLGESRVTEILAAVYIFGAGYWWRRERHPPASTPKDPVWQSVIWVLCWPIVLTFGLVFLRWRDRIAFRELEKRSR